MEDIADFLRGAVTSAGEGFLKAVAPVIDTAIEASKDFIADNTLDLAKAVDLSGAFIPSSPLAFASALQLARILTSVIAGDEDKSVLETIGASKCFFPNIPYLRTAFSNCLSPGLERLEKQVAPFTQNAENVLQQLDVIIKTGEQLELETHERVRSAAVSAYRTLEEAVESVLKIERGNARIQRVDPGVLTKLEAAVASFENLHKVSSTNAWKLGKDSAALMSFGDNTKNFKGTLEEERQKLKTQLKNNAAARGRHKDHMETLKKSEDTYNIRRVTARRELEKGINQFLSIFDGSSQRNQEAIMANATKAILENQREQRGVNNKIRGLHMLDTLIGWAMRALDIVKASVARIEQDFQTKFRLVTNAQQASDKLFAGLLGIANTIRDANFRTTRDNSLRVVLVVLPRYHELRDDHAPLQIPGIEERRIHRAIVNRVGRDGVQKLLEPPQPAEDEDNSINDL